MVTEAVILAAGVGSRMSQKKDPVKLTDKQSAVADTGVKALIPVHGRPFLDYVLSSLADAGIRKICLVIGAHNNELRRYYDDQHFRRIEIVFAVQAEPRGTADALLAAESFARDAAFLMINSDTYYPTEALQRLQAVEGPGLLGLDHDSFLARGETNIDAERLTQFAVLDVDSDGYLVDILEKPDAETYAGLPEPVRLNVNAWRFDPSIFSACRKVHPSPRGELELPDAVRVAIAEYSARFFVVVTHAPVLDLSHRSDISPVAHRLNAVKVDL